MSCIRFENVDKAFGGTEKVLDNVDRRIVIFNSLVDKAQLANVFAVTTRSNEQF